MELPTRTMTTMAAILLVAGCVLYVSDLTINSEQVLLQEDSQDLYSQQTELFQNQVLEEQQGHQKFIHHIIRHIKKKKHQAKAKKHAVKGAAHAVAGAVHGVVAKAHTAKSAEAKKHAAAAKKHAADAKAGAAKAAAHTKKANKLAKAAHKHAKAAKNHAKLAKAHAAALKKHCKTWFHRLVHGHKKCKALAHAAA